MGQGNGGQRIVAPVQTKNAPAAFELHLTNHDRQGVKLMKTHFALLTSLIVFCGDSLDCRGQSSFVYNVVNHRFEAGIHSPGVAPEGWTSVSPNNSVAVISSTYTESAADGLFAVHPNPGGGSLYLFQSIGPILP